MKLEVGPFDPALHVRSRDHHRAVCREAALRGLGEDSPPCRWQAAVARFYRHLRLTEVTQAVDRAFLAGEPAFTASATIPDAEVPAALAACHDLEGLLVELERWAVATDADVLGFADDVRGYYQAFLAQVSGQLRVARA